MAIVTALRFNEQSGALCSDRESWHILRRKSFFSDRLYLLVAEADADAAGVELAYAGVGHPSFHNEVAERAGAFIREHLAAGQEPFAETLARLALQAFSEVHRRRLDDRLQFLYGFNRDQLIAGEFTADGRQYPIKQDAVKQRALAILKGSESLGYAPLAPPLEACIIGADRQYGFGAFALKDTDGVLSFQSCGFEALGQGREAAAAQFAKRLNRRFLDQRRSGPGREEGWMELLEATLEACDHYGQVGGGVRALELQSAGATRSERVSILADHRANLALEIVRGVKEGLVERAAARTLIMDLVTNQREFGEVEALLFQQCTDPHRLEKILRGYKAEAGELPNGDGVLDWLQSAPATGHLGGRL